MKWIGGSADDWAKAPVSETVDRVTVASAFVSRLVILLIVIVLYRMVLAFGWDGYCTQQEQDGAVIGNAPR